MAWPIDGNPPTLLGDLIRDRMYILGEYVEVLNTAFRQANMGITMGWNIEGDDGRLASVILRHFSGFHYAVRVQTSMQDIARPISPSVIAVVDGSLNRLRVFKVAPPDHCGCMWHGPGLR